MMTQKYEREIEEILRNLDEFVPEEPLSRRVSARARSWLAQFEAALRQWRQYLTVQWCMVASIALVMLGFVLRMFSARLAWYANTLGLVLFVAAILMGVLHFGGPRRRKLWRGREVSYNSDWWQSLRQRWQRFWRKRRWQ